MAPKQVAASMDLDALMDINLTRQFFGNKSKMTIHRWVQNSTLGFPQPLQIAGQNYWVRGDLVAFRDRQREKTEKARAPGTQPDGQPAQAADDAGVS
jgi:hypothetical protein